MSADGGGREVAYRLFAAEYDDADYSYSESDEERAPNYVVTPTGARVNRLFIVGVLTEVESVSEDVLRARVADSTGAFVLYAGQYQPDEQAFLEAADPPAFVAVTGKARTFQPEDGDQIYTSVRPESINEVDADTRDRWTVQAAEQTIERIDHAATALSTGLSGDQLRGALSEEGMSEETAEGITIALDHYGTTPAYLGALRDVALDAARVVAGERDEVRAFDRGPADAGDVTPGDLVSETAAVSQVERAQAASEQADATATASETTASETTATTDETTPSAGDESEPVASTDEPAAETADESTETVDEPVTETADETVEEVQSGTAAEPDTVDEPATDTDAGGSADIEDPGDFDADEFELEEETREEIESEYGTDFQTGTEVDDPGEADIDTPATDDADPPVAGEEEPADDEPADADESGDETEPPADDESAADDADGAEPPEDIQVALLDVMAELDEGDGADREALLAEMDDRYGLDTDAVEDAIQDALMDGQCYEPDDSSLKPI